MRGRRLVSLLLLALPAAPTLAGCCTFHPAPADWLAVGYRSPAQCFHTFRTAVATDQLELEYRSLSSHFKHENRLDQLSYRVFRDQLAKENPWFHCLGKARVVEEQELGPDRARIVAEVDVLFVHRRFEIDFVREDFFETFSGEEGLLDESAAWSDLVRAAPDAEHVRVEVPTHGEFGLDQLTEVRVGREWKIDGFAALEGP